MPEKTPTYACVRNAWKEHEGELRRFLAKRLLDSNLADDLLQDVFFKAMRHVDGFCSLTSARAWLFEVARNAVIDHLRSRREHVAVPEDLFIEIDESPAVDGLAVCLPRVLSELPEQDREALTLCDLQGMTQEAFGRMKGLSLPAAKSRLQRARKRLREHMMHACQVQFDEAGRVMHFVPRPFES